MGLWRGAEVLKPTRVDSIERSGMRRSVPSRGSDSAETGFLQRHPDEFARQLSLSVKIWKKVFSRGTNLSL